MNTENVTLNNEQQIYVFGSSNGYSCFGFNNAFRETESLAEVLGKPTLKPQRDEFGTLAVLAKRAELLQLAAEAKLGTWFNPDTPKKVRQVLEKARREGTTLRLFMGDPETGRDWMEEHDSIGVIGRSMGVLKIPLLIGDDSIGGPGLLDSCILRIIRVQDSKELYRHPKYYQDEIQIVEGEHAEYPVSVLVGGKVHARFPTMGKAAHWVAFITGDVFQKP